MTTQDRFLAGVCHMKSLSDLSICYDRGSSDFVVKTGGVLMSAIREEMGPITMADLRLISTRDLTDASILLTSMLSHNLSMLQFLQSSGVRVTTLELWALVFEQELQRRGSHGQS